MINSSSDNVKKLNSINRRMFITGSLKFLIMLGIVTRLFSLQIRENKKYLTLSDKNRIREWKLAPVRGEFIDYFGNTIAGNFEAYELHIIPEEVEDFRYTIYRIKDLLNLKLDSDTLEIENLVKDVIYLPEYTTVLSALNILRENKSSFACVIDENGGIEGVITIKDVLSEFVGDLPDEHDQRFLGIRRLGPGQWRVDGKTDIDDFEEFFGLEESDKDIATVGGLFLSHSEQLPSEGEKIIIDGLEITVTELDNRRIESFIVKKIAKK